MSKDPLVAGNANLVPCVTNANVSLSAQPTSGGGGGGGGGGPNLTVSTITVAGGSGLIDMEVNSQLLIEYSSGSGAQIFFETDQSGQGNTYQLFQAYPANGQPVPFATPVPSLIDNNGNFGTLQVSGIAFDGNGQGSSAPGAYIRADPTGRLEAFATDLSISSITVSSINGATPGTGGAIPPTIQLSTIQFGDAGAGFGVLDVTGVNQLLIQNTLTSANDFQFYTNYQATATPGTAFVAIAPNTNTGINIVSQNSGENDILITGNYPLAVTASTIALKANLTTTSSFVASTIVSPAISTTNIQLSTINGASYPPTSSLYPYVSSINPGGGGGTQTQYFASTNQDVQVLTAFSTVVGHNYQLNLPFFVSTFQAPVYGEALQVFWAGVGATDLNMTIPLIQGANYNIPLPFKNVVTDGGVALLIGANTSYPVEINLGSSAGAELIDFGPSA